MLNGIALFLITAALSANAYAKTFVYCSEAAPKIFNPQLATDGATFNSTRPMYNRLVEFEHGGTKVIPSLAEKWTISKDGKVYTFKLRTDVKFHTTPYFKPTRNFNADDVVFTFNRMLKNDHPYNKVSGGTYEYFFSMDMQKLIASVNKKSPTEVEFVLTKPEAPFIANMAMDFASILSEEYGASLLKKNTPEKIDIEPIGTGPFVFKNYVKDNTIRYTANPDYFHGKAKIDDLVFSITTDPSVRFQKLRAKECQLVVEPSPADLPAMRKVSHIAIMDRPGLNIGYLSFNVQKKPFDNVKVRQALSMALNRESYINAIYLGNATVAKNPIPPTQWSYNNAVKDYVYNPTKAKELLKEAGYPNGFESELWILPVSRPYNPNGKKMGELMQSDLAKIGVKIKLMTYKWATYLEKAKNGEHQMMQIGWTGDNGDPDNFLNTLLGCAAVKDGSNYSKWCYQPYEKLIQLAKVTSDVPRRTKLYEEAQTIFKDQAPWVTLAHATVFRALDKSVTGYKISPFGIDSFYELDLK